MSLLMEALKQAEQSKRGVESKTPVQVVPEPVPDEKFLILENPEAADSAPAPLEIEPSVTVVEAPDASDPGTESLGMEEPCLEPSPDSSEALRAVVEEPAAKIEVELPREPVAAPLIAPSQEKIAKVELPPAESGPAVEAVKASPATNVPPPASPAPKGQADKPGSAALPGSAVAANPAEQQSGTPVEAKNLFAAKKSGRPSKRLIIWGGAAAVIVVVASGLGYRLWSEYNRPAMFPANLPVQSVIPAAKPEVAELAPSRSAAGSAAIEPAAVPPSQPAGQQASPLSPPAPIQSKGAKLAVTAVKIAKARPAPARVKPDEARQAKREPDRPADSAVVAPPVPPSAGSAGLPASASTVSQPSAIFQVKPVDQTAVRINNAYQAFLRGDFAAARPDYQLVVQQDPANRDALLGLAAIAMKKQEFEEAASLYLRLLALDPKDAVAQAGILSFNSGANPDESESRIKIYLNQQPNADFLHFVLGTIFMKQSRWPEAQQAFFRACQLNPANPDYTFNLAVSLDHLNQSRLAASYYRTALALADKHPSSFDRDSLRNRLQTISTGEAGP